MLNLQLSNQFKRDYKKIVRQGKKLNEKYKDHSLLGRYKDNRECHINSDWLLIYKIDNEKLVLPAVRTGSHSDLF